MSFQRRIIPDGRTLAPWAAGLMALAAAGAVWLSGCARNDPFDPESVANQRPEARIFVAPVDSADLAPTSYYKRRFAWSGTDRDGWVQEFHVSLRTPADTDAPWVVTTREDTLYTFTTDESGTTDALLLVACRDDRGAMSDTASQYFAIRNFPPEIVFQADFEPRANMQRSVVDNGGAAPDTTFWNYGFCNFRLYASDADGAETMNDYYRYTLADGEPDVTWDIDDPAADPESGWIRVPFDSDAEIKSFEIDVVGASPGEHTLTVSVGDESLSDTRLQYSWEVRAPSGNVLWVPDNTSTAGKTFFTEMLDATYGPGNWNTYQFLYAFPDRAWILLESMRLFDVVVWSDGGTTSPTLAKAATPGGVIDQYVRPLQEQDPGRLMMVSKVLTGSASGLAPAFMGSVLKIGSAPAPTATLRSFGGLQVLSDTGLLPAMTCASDFAQAVGLVPLTGAQWLYRFEECCTRGCFGSSRALEPCDPIAITRWPVRDEDPLARVIAVGLQPEYFIRAEAIAAFDAMLTGEMGVAAP
jgi:hypothetical protein